MQSVLLLVSAAAKETPMIDLDSTVFLQLGIFLVTAVVLSRFLFKPYLAVRNAREAGIDGAREEASRMTEEADARIAEYEAKMAKARLNAHEERQKLRAEAALREHEISDTTRRETQAAIDQAKKRLAAQAAATRDDLAPRVQEIATEMAKTVLGREVR